MKNVGRWQNRFEKNPLERMFAESWDDSNEWEDLTSMILYGETDSVKEVSDHDREIIATVIQWLGSSHGITFIYNAFKLSGFQYLRDLSKHIMTLGKEVKTRTPKV